MAGWRLSELAVHGGIGSGRRADVVAERRPARVHDPVHEAGIDADSLQRLQRLLDVTDRDQAASLEDDQSMLGERVAVPGILDARLQYDLRDRERRGPEVARLRDQPRRDPGTIDRPRFATTTDRFMVQ